MKLNLMFLIVFTIGAINIIHAQQEPMFTKYMFNTLSYNPAYVSANNTISIRSLMRAQWVNFEGAPTTQTISFSSPFRNQSAIYGLSILNDKIGATGKTFVNGLYSYHFPFSEGQLSIGLQGSIVNWRGNWNDITYRDPQGTDVVFDDSSFSKWQSNVGVGVYYYTDKFYLGYSVPYLMNNSLVDNNSSNQVVAKQFRHYYAMCGFAIPISGKDLVFKPSLLWKNVGLWEIFFKEGEELKFEGAPNEFDLDLSLFIRESIWFGVSLRSSLELFIDNSSSLDSGDLWLAYYLKNGMKVGVSYDYSLTKLQNYSSGSFEIFLGYDFDYEVGKFATPRYF